MISQSLVTPFLVLLSSSSSLSPILPFSQPQMQIKDTDVGPVIPHLPSASTNRLQLLFIQS